MARTPRTRPTAPRSARQQAPRATAAAPPADVPARVSLAAGLVALVVTLVLTPGVPGDKDAGEFTLVLARFGAAHPTGYPLYTLAGGAFVHVLHALGAGWAWAANAWSAAGGAVALALLHAFSARLLARAGCTRAEASVGGLLPAAALVLHPLWTDATTQAEVHSWHVAWALGLALVALARLARSEADEPGASRLAEPLAIGLLAGIGLAHHVTSLLVSGPVVLALGFARVRARRWHALELAVLAAGALVPLTAYGFIAWRAFHPAPGQWGVLAPNWPSVLAHVTGREYRIYVGRYAPEGPELELLQRHVYPWLAGLLPATAWWALAARRTPGALRIAIAGAVAATLAFVRLYGVPDPSAYFLPPLVLALAVAPAALVLLPGARRIARPLALVCALLAIASALAGVREALERKAAYEASEREVRRLWNSIDAPRGFLLWNDDMVSLLHGYQILNGEKPGLELYHPAQLTQDWPRGRFIARHGFDPISRADVAAAAAEVHPHNVQELATLMAGVIADRINAHSALPVLLFLPERGEVRTLEKPAAPDTTASPPAR